MHGTTCPSGEFPFRQSSFRFLSSSCSFLSASSKLILTTVVAAEPDEPLLLLALLLFNIDLSLLLLVSAVQLQLQWKLVPLLLLDIWRQAVAEVITLLPLGVRAVLLVVVPVLQVTTGTVWHAIDDIKFEPIPQAFSSVNISVK